MGGAGGRYGDGFAASGVGVVGEDAVFDEQDAEVDDFGVDPGADGGGEVGFELVDLWVVSFGLYCDIIV